MQSMEGQSSALKARMQSMESHVSELERRLVLIGEMLDFREQVRPPDEPTLVLRGTDVR